MSTVDTIALHGGYNPGNGEPRQVPIYQSTTWKYATSEALREAVTGQRMCTRCPSS